MPFRNGNTAAQRCLGAAITALAGEEPAGVSTASAEVGGSRITVTVVPLADVRKPAVEYTGSELAILTVVAESPVPLTRPQILRELELRGHVAGSSTVAHSLSHLVKLGVLTSRSRKPRGYTVVAHTS